MNPGTKASVGLSMHPVNRTCAPLQALADELARCGMTHAVTCPGSRNAPLDLPLAETEGSRRCPSSTSARPGSSRWARQGDRAAGRGHLHVRHAPRANLLPAVVEAHEARVPLLVLTADRPPELRDVGAGQAIDQLKIYGSFAKWSSRSATTRPAATAPSTTARSHAGRTRRPPAGVPARYT